MQFQISATLSVTPIGNSSSNGTELPPSSNEVLTLSPSVPVAISSNRTVAFKLLGDLTGYTAIPVLRCVALVWGFTATAWTHAVAQYTGVYMVQCAA